MAREKNDNKHRKKELLSMKRYTMTIDRLIDVGQMVWLTTSENTEEMLTIHRTRMVLTVLTAVMSMMPHV